MKTGSPKAGKRSAAIYVRNLQRKIPVNAEALELFAARALRACEKLRRDRDSDNEFEEICVLLISDRRMSGLHRKFMNESGPTDVITFQHGEILVSVDTARRQARQFGTSMLDEIRLYIVHGLLHLHGFDDRTTADAKRMRAAEATILRRVVV